METGKLVVYQAVNLINGKRYIGYTTVGLPLRRKHHIDKASTKRWPFARAIAKYGKEMIRFRTLKECSSVAELKTEEARLISLMKPEYNLTTGGDGAPGFRHTEETKRAISIANSGKRGTCSFHSEETKRKISAAATRMWADGKFSNKKKAVICVDDGIVFDCARSASSFYRTHQHSVSSAIRRGHRLLGKTFVWAAA